MGQYSRMIQVVDTHTCGQPTRTVVSGVPRLYGSNMMEKMQYFKQKCEWIYSIMIFEPRGSSGSSLTSVAVITEPTDPTADIGAFYFEAHGYLPMCGHDTIGLCTMLVELGFVEVKSPITKIVLETPAGIVNASVEVQDGRAVSVSFSNVPCFTYETDMVVEFEGKSITFDISYGGNFYAIVPATALGVEIKPSERRTLVSTAVRFMDAVNDKYNVVHPEDSSIAGVTHVQVTDPLERQPGFVYSKNCVVTQPDGFDRSPCGTGTSARMALLYSKNLMDKDTVFQHRSIIDSVFEARIIDEVNVSGYKGIIPRIKGSANITGFATLIVDPHDKKGLGFKVE